MISIDRTVIFDLFFCSDILVDETFTNFLTVTMRYFNVLAASASVATAFPSFAPSAQAGQAEKQTVEQLARRAVPLPSSAGETNCGPIPCTTFDEQEQLVSIEGTHAFVAPGPTDLRGPCPGLNAAANHGYSEQRLHIFVSAFR